MKRYMSILCCALAVSTSVSVLGAANAANAEAPRATPALQSAAAASAEAQASGQPVDIPVLTDEYSKTEALPNGNFRRSITNVAERAQVDGEWRDLDASLVANGDGSFSPLVSSEPLKLSGGGRSPLAVLSRGDSTMSLTWPTELPVPQRQDDTLVYPDVLPEVDLQVTATESGGIAEVLVVKTAAAAADSRLDELKLAVSTNNATLQTDTAGNLSARDGSGEVVFTAPTPLMWDSGDATAAAASPDDPAEAPPASADVATIDVDVEHAASGTTLSLVPDQGLLQGADTNYPVYIDPSFGPKHPAGWAWAQQAYPTSSWYNTNSNGRPAVGYQGWESTARGMNRAFYQFAIGDLGASHVISAALQLTQIDTGNFDCDLRKTISVYNSGVISSATTWNKQPTRGSKMDDTVVTGSGGSCPNKNYRWSVASVVASDDDGTVSFRVQAPDGHEDERDYYRRFGSNGDTTAALVAEYNWVPSAVNYLGVSPVPQNPASGCDPNAPGWIGSLAGSNLTLGGKLYDRDQPGGQPVYGEVQLWDKGGTGTATAVNVVAMGSSTGRTGSTTTQNYLATKAFSPSLLDNGHKYGFQVRANDGTDVSPDGADCYFWYDNTAPSAAINAAASGFRSDGTSTAKVGDTGTFVVNGADFVPSGANYSKINHFRYSFASEANLANDGGTLVPVSSSSGQNATGSFTYKPTYWGTQYLYVSAIDNAGNQSATAKYEFYVRDSNLKKAGDVTGDARSDLIGVRSGSLYVYQAAASRTGRVPAAQLAANTSSAPGSGDWSGTLISHGSGETSSASGSRIDDLWAVKPSTGDFFLYTNNLSAPGGIETAGAYYDDGHRTPVYPPQCADCPGYTETWTDVSQMSAVGDLTGPNEGGESYVDLLVTKTDGSLWLYPGTGTTGQLGIPQRLAATGWFQLQIISSGDSSGDGVADVWARDTSSGDVRMYRTVRGADGTVSLAAPVSQTGAAPTSSDRLVASVGDTDGDGLPELYSVTTTSPSQLAARELQQKSSTTVQFLARAVVDDGAGGIDWSQLTALS